MMTCLGLLVSDGDEVVSVPDERVMMSQEKAGRKVKNAVAFNR